MDWRIVLIAALAGLLGGTSIPVMTPDVVRPDPFTGAAARDLEARILAEVERRHELVILRLESRLPPEATRRRIEAIEEAIRELLPTWRPPTSRFSRAAAQGDGNGG